MAESTLTTQVSELESQWCYAIDGHDLTMIRTLFVDGGTFETRGQVMTNDERDAFFTDLWATRSDRSTHVIREPVVTEQGDLLHIKALLTATFILPDGGVRLAFGHYNDTAKITPDGLRFVSKQVNLERIEEVA
ncbi:MAG: hypothetical protein JWM76_3933 [Pseudonocardiales bacterium]|nr:hypothetical protein [Pseudonocardiales bacterium]